MADSRTIARTVLTAVAVLAALFLLYLVRHVIELLLIAVFLAVALAPAVVLFERRLRLPRGLAILAVYVVGLLAVFGVGLLLIPPLVDEVEQFVADVPGYVSDLENSDTFQRYDQEYGISDKLRDQAESLPERLGSFAGSWRALPSAPSGGSPS